MTKMKAWKTSIIQSNTHHLQPNLINRKIPPNSNSTLQTTATTPSETEKVTRMQFTKALTKQSSTPTALTIPKLVANSTSKERMKSTMKIYSICLIILTYTNPWTSKMTIQTCHLPLKTALRQHINLTIYSLILTSSI